ncbi:MAG: (2Fe-2S) ferredoxin domain-containing protein [Opitutaceae bacterium]|nr:(2Fe-2S) ferredoxin domain-containing protein [Opitutaceae bacterium]
MGAKTFAEIGQPTARHHLFLCVGPDCCSNESGLATWEHMKASLKECRLPALRTKAACLRMCHDGPWLVVYPDGVWYSGVTPEKFDRIRREHLERGEPVREWVRAVNPLGQTGC